MNRPWVIAVSDPAKLGIGSILAFWPALGMPYAAEVQALPCATSALIHGAPSMRARDTRWPAGSITANDIGTPSSVAASRAAAQRAVASSRVSMRSVCRTARPG